MARLLFVHRRISCFNFTQITLFAACIFGIANASAETTTKRPAILVHSSTNLPFCANVLSIGYNGSTNCVVPWSCTSYYQSTAPQDGKNATVELMHCPIGEEFSLDQRVCQAAGTRATCTEFGSTFWKNTWEKIQQPLLDKTNPQLIANAPDLVSHIDIGPEMQKMMDHLICNRFQMTGCKEATDCNKPARSIVGDCRFYVQCSANPNGKTGTAHIKTCPKGESFSLYWGECHTADASTCNGSGGLWSELWGQYNPWDQLPPWHQLNPEAKNTTILEHSSVAGAEKDVTHHLHGRAEGLAVLERSANLLSIVDLSLLCKNADASCTAPDGSITPCPPLSEKTSNSTCEINRNFKCPDEDSAEEDSPVEDCKKAIFNDVNGEGHEGYLCKSSKGPDRYIACSQSTRNAFELHCPDNEIFELLLPGGPRCRKPPNYQFPFTRKDEFKCPILPPEQCYEDPYSCIIPIPGRCNGKLQCMPQSISQSVNPEQPITEYCGVADYYDSNLKNCMPLAGYGVNSTCEVDSHFTCPRKRVNREDCEKIRPGLEFGSGQLCLSSKGPEWYIACFAGLGDRNAYQMRCPPGFIFDLDLDEGPGCHPPYSLPDPYYWR